MEKNEYESYIKAGRIAKEVKEFARNLIKPDMKLIDIASAIDSKIEELGGEPAFPVNLSINEIAAHFTPAGGDESVAHGLLKIDLGVHVGGYIADTAFSMDLTEDGEFKEMIKLNDEILKRITFGVVPRVEAKIVGEIAQDTLKEWNEKNKSRFSIIKSLSGHALGIDTIHAGLTISNYRNDNTAELDDMAFAIEPFVTTGVGDVYEGSPGGIYVLQRDDQGRDKEARVVLNFIKENYKSRPFCIRWLEKKGFQKLRFVMAMLTKQGILYQYPLLIEKSKAPVSQSENTFVVYDGAVVRTTE